MCSWQVQPMEVYCNLNGNLQPGYAHAPNNNNRASIESCTIDLNLQCPSVNGVNFFDCIIFFCVFLHSPK